MAKPTIPLSRESESLSLPTETLYRILSFMTPQELIGLQKISKKFHAITNDPALWRTMYRNARLPRPPGPFPWQSTRFLQRTLIHSSRLIESWTSQPVKVVSPRRVFHGQKSGFIDDYRWLHGRWLISTKERKQIVSRDIDTGSQQTLWDAGPVSWWTARCIASAHGHWICIALRIGRGDNEDAMKLIGFLANDDSGYLSDSFLCDVPTRCLVEQGKPLNLRVRTGSVPFVCISADKVRKVEDALIFDIRRQIFFKFPPFYSEVRASDCLPDDIVIQFTTTHIITYDSHAADGREQLIQAFIIPDNPLQEDNGFYELRLSHETITHKTQLDWLIRNSVVHPLTKSTTLRFMHTLISSGPIWSLLPLFRFVCVELTLPEPATDGITPISVDTHEIFTCQSVEAPGEVFIEASDDGFVRGFCMMQSISASRNSMYYTVRKFTIDASGDRCTAVFGDPSPPWLGHDLDNWNISSFDGVRGRVCYPERSSSVGGDLGDFAFAFDFV